MDEVLNIGAPVLFEDAIEQYELQAHQPYATTSFNNNDEIHIAIQHQDQYVLPCKSYIHIQGKIAKPDGGDVERTLLTNFGICYMFSENRYEINAQVIDRCKNVGATTLMKGYLSYPSTSQKSQLINAGWLMDNENDITDDSGRFDVMIPLSKLFGFAEDYRHIVVHQRHELILTRANSDVNAVVQTVTAANPAAEQYKITLTKIEWLMPSIVTSDKFKIGLLKRIEKHHWIPMSFRSWDLYEYPILPQTRKHIWSVKTTSQLEKPRFIAIGF